MTYWEKLREIAAQMQRDNWNVQFERGADAIGTLLEVASYLDGQDRKAKRLSPPRKSVFIPWSDDPETNGRNIEAAILTGATELVGEKGKNYEIRYGLAEKKQDEDRVVLWREGEQR